jgi:hypothetical protein
MVSPQQFSVRRRDTNKHNDTEEAESNTRYDVDRAVRLRLRNEAWAGGFLAADGTQIPLFVRPAQQLK